MKNSFWRFAPALGGAVLAVAVSACSASTSHIGSLTLATDEAMTKPASDIAANDSVYAKAEGDNLANKVTMNMELDVVDVKGMPAGAIKPTVQSYDIDDSKNVVSYHLTPPGSGWPPGTYKVVATMMDNGTQRDQKSVTFTVGGAAAASAGAAGSENSATSSSDDSANSSSQ